MKKYLLIINLLIINCIFTNNLYAVQHAIGVSSGIALHHLKGEQDILYYPNPDKHYMTILDKPLNAHFYRALNLSLDYQSRFDNFIIGINASMSNPNYRGYLTEDEFTKAERIKIITNMVDVSLEGLIKLGNFVNFNIYGGGSLGFGFMHIAENSTWFVLKNSNHNNVVYIIPKIILYTEYNFSKKIALYSKFNFTPKIFTDDIVYQVNPNLVKPDDNRLVQNTITAHTLTMASFNIGLLYKF